MDQEKVWKRAVVTSLIYLYKEKMCLCKVTSSQYTNKSARTDAWNSITTALNSKWGLRLTSKDVSNKIAGLRTNLSKEIKLVKLSKTSGAGDEDGTEIYEPTWWAFSLLLFLREYITPTVKSTSNLNIGQSSCQTMCVGEYEVESNGFLTKVDRNQTDSQESEVFSETVEMLDDSDAITNTGNTTPTFCSTLEPHIFKAAATKKQKKQSLAQDEALRMMQRATGEIEKLGCDTSDDVAAFGATVVAEMRQIYNKSNIRMAKQKILGLLHELQEEEEKLT